MITDPHNSEIIYFTAKTIIIGNGLKQGKEVHVIAWYFEKIKFSTFFGDIRPHFSFVLRWCLTFVLRWCLTWTYRIVRLSPKGNTSSRLFTEVKPCWTGLISGWVTI